MKPEEQSRQQLELAGWPVIVESYRLGDVYHCYDLQRRPWRADYTRRRLDS